MDGFTSHGGRLDAAMRAWPDAPTPWIDLSTGINPRPYPAPRASRAARARLPLPERDRRPGSCCRGGVRASTIRPESRRPPAQRRRCGSCRICSGAETVWIAEPTYASHADAWSQAGARRVEGEAEAGVAVVVNPNNPDGQGLEVNALQAMADRLAARDGWLVVDESFADTLPGASIAALGHPRIVALRSFGKFYGLAGLRLGFVLGAPDLVRRVRAVQGNWPVCADAIAAGLAAYADQAWTARTRTRLIADAARLDAALRDGGFEIIGGTCLFRLAKVDDAPDRFAALCAQGILTRPFAAERTWLRFGLPHPSVRARVAAALRMFV